MIRGTAFVSVVALIAGVALVVAGRPVIGALLIVFGLLAGAVAWAVSTALRMKATVEEWAGVLRGGGPRAVRIVSIEPPTSVIFDPQASITVEIEGADGNLITTQRDVSVPRLQALAWKLARRSPLPVPERFDFERQLRLQLRSAG